VIGANPDVKLATQVGRPFSIQSIDEDMRSIWSLGRFDDIRVETAEQDGGTAVLFHVVASPALRLHDVRIEPSSYALTIKPPEGTLLNAMRAHLIAEQARMQLEQHGYVGAKVDYEFVPFAKGIADLKLNVRAADPVRVRTVDFSGDTFLNPRRELRALHTRRILFWKLAPSYSEQAVRSDVAHILSLYLSNGYLDARVRAEEPEFQSNGARFAITIEAGERYQLQNPISCADLFAQRREAQRQGVLDFDVRARFEDGEMKTVADRGPAYSVGRINFSGHHHHCDLTIRKNFVLNEAEPFDEYKLRKSIARLNRTSFFQPIDVKDVLISPHESTGVADVTVRLTERKRGKWSFSGPVGPVSIGGPLNASISSRVPGLASFTASMSLIALAHPIVPVIPVKKFMPVAALERPFDPGNALLTGFVVAPQLGWPATAISYAASQLKQRLGPVLTGDRGLVTELPVTIETRTGEKTIYCEPPDPKFWPLRRAAGIGLQIIGGVPGL
jgi:outer membrane protein insertion porin family